MDRFCGRCGNKVVQEARFCPVCGADISTGENYPIEQPTPMKANKPWYKKWWGIMVLTFFGTIFVFVALMIFIGASSREDAISTVLEKQEINTDIAATPVQSTPKPENEEIGVDENLPPGERKYREGRELYEAQEYSKAAVAFAEAMKSGNAEAKFFMSTMYSFGRGVKKNEQEAERLRHEAAAEGSANALASLGHKHIIKAMTDKELIWNIPDTKDFSWELYSRVLTHKDYIYGMELIRKAMESETDWIGYTVMSSVLYIEYPLYDKEDELIPENIPRYIDLYREAGKRGWKYADSEIARLRNLPEIRGFDSRVLLIDAYTKDLIKAEEKYYGKIVQVHGRVESITKDSRDQYCITLWLDPYYREKMFLQFHFGRQHVEELVRLEKEQKKLAKVDERLFVDIQGKVGKYDGSKLDITDCRIVPPDVVSVTLP